MLFTDFKCNSFTKAANFSSISSQLLRVAVCNGIILSCSGKLLTQCKETSGSTILIPAKLKGKQTFCILIMCTAAHSKPCNNSSKALYSSRLVILGLLGFSVVGFFAIHYDISHKKQRRAGTDINSTQYYPDVHWRPQILTPALHFAEQFSTLTQPFKYSNILLHNYSTILRQQTVTSSSASVCDGTSPRRHDLFPKQDFQQKAWSTMNLPTEHCNQVSWAKSESVLDKILESLQVCDQTRNCSAQCVTAKTQTGRNA